MEKSHVLFSPKMDRRVKRDIKNILQMKEMGKGVI